MEPSQGIPPAAEAACDGGTYGGTEVFRTGRCCSSARALLLLLPLQFEKQILRFAKDDKLSYASTPPILATVRMGVHQSLYGTAEAVPFR
jgi:hypothetical protein